MSNKDTNLIFVPKDANYIEILGHRIDGFDSFEDFCEYLNRYAELEEMVKRLQAENERLEKVRKDEVEKLMSAIDRTIAEAKAEAYKEFVYELKQIPRVVVLKREIDDLLEEKIGKIL